MILLVDNSEYRRDSLVVRLRIKGYIVAGIDYAYMDSYTKPFMTVYINPPRNEAVRLKNEETISVIFTDREATKLPPWSINILSLNNVESEIVSIYNEKCNYMLKDKIDIIGYLCRKNDRFAVGGREISLSNMQSTVLSLFIYNPSKRFKLYEASKYFHFSANSEERFVRIVYEINKKAKAVNRDRIIIREGDLFYLNPDIKNYVCKEDDDIDIIKDDTPLNYLRLDMSYDI